MLRMRIKNSRILVLLFAFLLSFLSCRNYIFEDGYIYLAEQFEVYSDDQFWRYVYPTWNDRLQAFNVVSLSKLYYYALLVGIGKLFNSYKLLQLIALVLPIFVAFVSSFILNEHLLSRHLGSSRSVYVFISAFV